MNATRDSGNPCLAVCFEDREEAGRHTVTAWIASVDPLKCKGRVILWENVPFEHDEKQQGRRQLPEALGAVILGTEGSRLTVPPCPITRSKDNALGRLLPVLELLLLLLHDRERVCAALEDRLF